VPEERGSNSVVPWDVIGSGRGREEEEDEEEEEVVPEDRRVYRLIYTHIQSVYRLSIYTHTKCIALDAVFCSLKINCANLSQRFEVIVRLIFKRDLVSGKRDLVSGKRDLVRGATRSV